MELDLKIQNTKLELIQWLSSLENISLINKISDIKQADSDWWNDISDVEKESIELGLKDIEDGNVVSHEDFLKSYGR